MGACSWESAEFVATELVIYLRMRVFKSSLMCRVPSYAFYGMRGILAYDGGRLLNYSRLFGMPNQPH